MERKTVLITGSTSGIGLGIAKVFASRGYFVLIHGLDPEPREIAKALSAEYRTDVLCDDANLVNPSEIERMVREAERHWGGIDVLINNAGIQHVAPIEEFPEEKWDAILSINLKAAFLTSKAAWPLMKKRKFGRIINIASVHGLVASEFKVAYVAAKHGLLGLTKVLALEGANTGITCNAICPGYVNTPLVEKQIALQAQVHGISENEVVNKIFLAKHAIKEMVAPSSIGEFALFLAGEGAGQITGAAFPVDGGWLAQ